MSWQDVAYPLIKGEEGCSLVAYHGACDRPGVWTIGWGETGPGIVEGTSWTQEQCDAAFEQRMTGYGSGVDTLVKVPIDDNQKAALVSFAENLGLASLQHSTLLTMLNDSNYSGASAQFPYWNHSDGQVVPGLTGRRAAERILFDTPIEVTP